MANSKELNVKVKLTDAISNGFTRLSGSLRKMVAGFKSNFGGLATSFQSLKSSISGSLSALGGLALKTAAVGGTLAWGFKRNFLDVASTFENMETVLTTLEGSSQAAKKAMDWISNFAVTTPYELASVTEAYKNLVGSGIDPMNGSLKSIGDAAAASGKPLLQLVDAVGKAKSGQFEQLRTAIGGIYKMVGDKMTYTFFDKDKQKVTLYADVKNMEAMEKMVYEVFDRKGYSGSMQGLSKTWSGMMSNMSDQWTRFSKMVMQSGPFEWLKNELSNVLSRIDAMAADGSLQIWAEQVGKAFVDGFNMVKAAVVEAWNIFKGFAGFIQGCASFVGGFKNLLMVLAGFMAGPLVMALAVLGKAFLAFGLTMLTNPIGQFIFILFGAIVALKKIADFSLKIASLLEGGTGWVLEKIFGKRAKAEKNEEEPVSAEQFNVQSPSSVFSDRPLLMKDMPASSTKTERYEESKTLRTEIIVRGENLPTGMRLGVQKSDADRTEIGLTRTLAGV